MHVSGNGYVCRDAKVVSDKLVAFSIGVNKGKDDKKKTSFFDCKAIGMSANQAKSFKQGDYVMVSGELDQESWEKDGVKNYKIVVLCFSCAVVSAKVEKDAAPATAEQPQTEQAPF